MSRPTGAENAVEALLSVATFLGLDAVRATNSASAADIVIAVPGGRMVVVEVKSASLISADSAVGQLARWSTRSRHDVVQIAVADRITADARAYLTREGWSWLDLRGHMRLTGPGLFVDSDIPAVSERRPGRAGFTGQVSVEVAASLLLDPDRPVGIRATASSLSRAPSSVSDAMGALRAAGLVDSRSRPEVPELFWELAEQWKPISRDVLSLPRAGRGRDNAALRLGFDDVGATIGWALTDTVAAAVYGAAVATRSDHPRDVYVPDQATLRRATQLLGLAENAQTRAGQVRVAPVAAVCSQRIDASGWANEQWPLAHPLFVALDLGQDPGRGREILDGWTPREPWRRVW